MQDLLKGINDQYCWYSGTQLNIDSYHFLFAAISSLKRLKQSMYRFLSRPGPLTSKRRSWGLPTPAHHIMSWFSGLVEIPP